MFVTRRTHDRLVAELHQRLASAEATGTAARQRAEAAALTASHWRVAALEAQRALVALQRRYAPPEPVPEGDLAQPPSVTAADRLMARAQAKATGTAPLVRDPADGDRHYLARERPETP